jgi:hypothetical protein
VNVPKNLGSRANIGAVADDRGSTLACVAEPYRHSIADNTIISEDRVSTDDDSSEVIDPEAPSDFRFTGKFNPGQDLREKPEEFIKKGEWQPQCSIPNPVSPMAEAVHDHDPEPLTNQLSFVGAPILTDILEHAIAP